MRYLIKQGKRKPTKCDAGRLLGAFDKLTWEVTFLPDSVFNYKLEDGTIDRDAYDWKKGGGIVLFNWFSLDIINLFVRSRDNTQWAFRYNPHINKWEVCIYSDYKYKEQVSRAIVLNIDKLETILIELERLSTKDFRWSIYRKNKLILREVVVHRKEWKQYSKSGLYYGGKNNSPGTYGGKAPRDFLIYISFYK